MSRCTAIKPSGERCKGRAIEGSEWCWNHDPAHAADHRRHGAKGGKRGGRGRPAVELTALKEQLQDMADKVLAGELDRSAGAVAGQLLNIKLRAIEIERRVKEAEELETRIAALESAQDAQRGAKTWGRR